MQLVNLQTGNPEELPDEEGVPALAAGTHTPLGAKALIDPKGRLVYSPTDDVQTDLSNGYAYPTQAQLDGMAKQAKYGTVGQQAKTVAEGLLRGGTFGASTYGEKLLGVKPEDIKGRMDVNPGESTTSEVVGAVGSSLLAPELSPAGLLSKAGTGIAEKLAPEALSEGAGLAGRVLNHAGQMGAKFAGSSLEAAAYTGAQDVNEAALGDPNLTAEKVMAHIGFGAFLGGAIGGLLKAGEIAAPAAIDTVSNALAKARDTLVGAPGEDVGIAGKAFAKVSSFFSGEDPAKIVDAIKNRANYMEPKEAAELAKNIRSSIGDVHDANADLVDKVSGARSEETAAMLQGADLNKVYQGANEADQAFTSAIKTMRDEPDLYPKKYSRVLEKIQEGFQNRVTSESVDAATAFEALNTAKKLVEENVPYEKIRQNIPLSPEEKRIADIFKPLADDLRTGLEDESRWGVAGARQSAAESAMNGLDDATKDLKKAFWNKQLGDFDPKKINTYINDIKSESGAMKSAVIQRFFDASHEMVEQAKKTAESAAIPSFDAETSSKLIGNSQDLVGTAQNALMGTPSQQGFGFLNGLAARTAKAMIDPYTAIGRLGNLERAAQKSSAVITAASKAVFNSDTTNALSRLVGPIAGELSKDDQEKQYNKRIDEIQQYNNAPAKAIDKLDWVTKDMYHVAPNVSSAMQMTAIKGNQFLSSKIPQPASPKLPFDRPFAPSRVQMIKFDRYYNVVHRPLSALSELKAGKVNPETVETLQTVYPQLYTEMKTELLNSLTSAVAKKQEVPLQRRMAISMFLGQAVDSSTQSIASNQMAIAQRSADKQTDQGALKSTAKGVGNLTLSDRLQTNIQSTSQRERA